jgi:hypothetical protein
MRPSDGRHAAGGFVLIRVNKIQEKSLVVFPPVNNPT